MQEDALRDMVRMVRRLKTELQNIELKAAHEGFPKRIYDTLSSFSNLNDGGVMIFGVADKPSYEVVGVYDPEGVQRKIMEACNQMEPPVRALITLCEIGEKIVVSAEIPSVEYSRRPVFYKGHGRLKGSFVRVGDADEPMTEYEVYSYEAFRSRTRDELRPVEEAKLELFDQNRLARYLGAVREQRPNLSDMSDADILELMGVTRDGKPTLAGVMVFSRYPQAYYPQLSLTAIVVPGTQIGDEGPEGERFMDNVRITGSIPEMLDAAEDFVRRNSRTKTVIDANGRRVDRPEYPGTAVREAILNMLVHRDYSIHTENIPAGIEMYRDRIVFRSSGGLMGGVSLELLGKSHLETRNTKLTNILEILRVTENRYSGIPTMRRELENAGMRPPVFAERHGEFSTTFINNIFEVKEAGRRLKPKDMSRAILDFCQTPRSRAELVAFTGKSRYYTLTRLVRALIDEGRLRRTIPEKPRSPKQRFVAI